MSIGEFMVELRHESGGGRHLALLHRPKPEHRLFRPPLLATRLGSRLCLGDRTDRLSLEMERFIGQNGIGTVGHPAAAGYAALTALDSSRQGRAQLLLLALERGSPRACDDAVWLEEAIGRTGTIVFSAITLAFLQRRTAPFFAEPDPQATITRYQALGLDRIIVKNGGKRIVLSDHCAIRRIETVPVAAVVDSTSAGDSRNGAFLARFPALGGSVEAAHHAAPCRLHRHRASGRTDRAHRAVGASGLQPTGLKPASSISMTRRRPAAAASLTIPDSAAQSPAVVCSQPKATAIALKSGVKIRTPSGSTCERIMAFSISP
ncbi:carbohydrate kinase family protein [Sinorhizobium medicae]|nr:carbohydrate kinase family protein [Sinorhizobium medicae]